jgi:hypothetical protein
MHIDSAIFQGQPVIFVIMTAQEASRELTNLRYRIYNCKDNGAKGELKIYRDKLRLGLIKAERTKEILTNKKGN